MVAGLFRSRSLYLINFIIILSPKFFNQQKVNQTFFYFFAFIVIGFFTVVADHESDVLIISRSLYLITLSSLYLSFYHWNFFKRQKMNQPIFCVYFFVFIGFFRGGRWSLTNPMHAYFALSLYLIINFLIILSLNPHLDDASGRSSSETQNTVVVMRMNEANADFATTTKSRILRIRCAYFALSILSLFLSFYH